MSYQIEFSEAADPFPRSPSFNLPTKACDTHAHVFGPQCQYPYAPNRSYTPSDAPVGAYLHLHQRLGIERGILVQPSIYGTDNQLHLDSLNYIRMQGKDYKGIAVVAANVSEAELDTLADSGYCGGRMNLLFKGGIEWRDIVKLADRFAARDWHLQFLVDVSNFEHIESRVKALPVPVVFDHMGHMDCERGIQNNGFQALLKLLRDGRAWVKLSGAYRNTHEMQPPYLDIQPFAQSLIEANSERCIWGSDWPHPHISKAMPNDGELLDLLFKWAPDETTRNRILVDNPANLYGFSG